MTSIRLLSNRVLLELKKKEDKKNGVIIPETHNSTTREAVVVATGNKHFERTFKEGDTVIIPFSAGTKITFDQKDYLLVFDTDIYAVLG